MGEDKTSGPFSVMPLRQLPIIKVGAIDYFFDFRLSQLRQVDNPHRFINLNSDERKTICDAISLASAIKNAHSPSIRKETNIRSK
jgi:hypothetical protein